MAFTTTIKKTAIGYGDPMFYIAATELAVTNTQTNTVTCSLTTSYSKFTTIGSSHGKWRVKIMPLTTAVTVSSVTITASNGTTSENIYAGGSWATNSRNLNLIGEYITDLEPGYNNWVCTVVFSGAATGTLNFEVFGQPANPA